MPRTIKIERRSAPRYLATFQVRAEWDNDEGAHVVEEGKMENVGPEGTLVHLNRLLPRVGSHVSLAVALDEDWHEAVNVRAEVLRIERNAAHPQAALMLLETTDEWRSYVWEPAIPRQPEPDTDEDDEDGEDDGLL
jgi:hypothetical protein